VERRGTAWRATLTGASGWCHQKTRRCDVGQVPCCAARHKCLLIACLLEGGVPIEHRRDSHPPAVTNGSWRRDALVAFLGGALGGIVTNLKSLRRRLQRQSLLLESAQQPVEIRSRHEHETGLHHKRLDACLETVGRENDSTSAGAHANLLRFRYLGGTVWPKVPDRPKQLEGVQLRKVISGGMLVVTCVQDRQPAGWPGRGNPASYRDLSQW
jgi:hypothetical protein